MARQPGFELRNNPAEDQCHRRPLRPSARKAVEFRVKGSPDDLWIPDWPLRGRREWHRWLAGVRHCKDMVALLSGLYGKIVWAALPAGRQLIDEKRKLS
jgi:hypothetical protein